MHTLDVVHVSGSGAFWAWANEIAVKTKRKLRITGKKVHLLRRAMITLQYVVFDEREPIKNHFRPKGLTQPHELFLNNFPRPRHRQDNRNGQPEVGETWLAKKGRS